MKNISVIDVPVCSVYENSEVVPRNNLGKKNPDQLGTGQYAKSLADFIIQCQTPLTIGVQGEWGSGKTSLLNMIREDIGEASAKGKLKGTDLYRPIWINTWEHSLLKTPEQCLMSIIEEIIEEIANVDGSYSSAAKAKNALVNLAKGAAKVGAGMTMGLTGAKVVGDMVDGESSNSVKQLRRSLNDIVTTVVQRRENSAERFVIFIDDLDRLEPPTAVAVLELLKNIFNIEHCVFVLAIDYQVVVKGLKDKFGEPNEENEWEFRAFFDKIIQLPFMMPMATYQVNTYVKRLLQDISYFSSAQLKATDDGFLGNLVKHSLGYNPRSIKRLLNSLSLINIQHTDRFKDADTNVKTLTLKQLVFALVCFQISFPKIYELLIKRPDYTNWDEEFVNVVTGGPHDDNRELADSLDKAVAVNEEEFDDEWEQSLFKIVWLKSWQKNRVTSASKMLNLIHTSILSAALPENEYANALKEAIQISIVTSVISTDENVFTSESETADEQKKLLVEFWREFGKQMKLGSTIFNPQMSKMSSTYSSWGIMRASQIDRSTKYDVNISCIRCVRLYRDSISSEENLQFFKILENNINRIAKVVSCAPSDLEFKHYKGGQFMYLSFATAVFNGEQLKGKFIDIENRDKTIILTEWLNRNLDNIDKEIACILSDLSS